MSHHVIVLFTHHFSFIWLWLELFRDPWRLLLRLLWELTVVGHSERHSFDIRSSEILNVNTCNNNRHGQPLSKNQNCLGSESSCQSQTHRCDLLCLPWWTHRVRPQERKWRWCWWVRGGRLLRRPGTLSHTQTPPAFSVFVYDPELTQLMHAALCVQQRPRPHRPSTTHTQKGRDCACVNSRLLSQAQGPVNLIPPLTA